MNESSASVNNLVTHLREATVEDIPEITEIYRAHVEHELGTFEEIAPTSAEMLQRYEVTKAIGLPYRIAESQGEVAGFAYASPYHSRSAYRFTLQHSIHVREPHRGIGQALLQDLMGACAALGYRQLIAFFGDSKNEASIRLHTRAGFRYCGQLTGAGFKFGRWVDVVIMQASLGDGASKLPVKNPEAYGMRRILEQTVSDKGKV